ncbi:MAG: endonuclease/exonuclease/phosphatase family protein [Candidatus Zixiibacteriota bacterium]|nr:MAG: endonuclease/exonuclease/phosphatase family protein [candidate division Zixibacteria bacterium]
MKHGEISKSVARGLRVLRERIAEADIPSSSLDESINLATWNIRDFGKSPRLDASIHYIAEILNQFDLIAITEVRDNLTDLSKVMKILGPYWDVVFSDYDTDSGGNHERIAYLYDKRAVTFTGLAAEPEGPRKKDKKSKEYLPKLSWWRKPYMASFRAGSFDFILLTAHIRWGKKKQDRIAPLKLLAEWVHKRRNEAHVVDRDFIVLGDFNILKVGDELFKAVTSKGLMIPEGLKGKHGTNLARAKHYDQILHSPAHEGLFTDRGGKIDFYDGSFAPLYPGVKKTDKQLTWELSDHLPLWIQVNVDLEDVETDQILAPKKRRKRKR